MEERSSEAVRRYIAGEKVTDIAQGMGVSRSRVYQLIQEGRARNSVHVQIKDVRGDVSREALADYLRRALAQAGFSTHRAE